MDEVLEKLSALIREDEPGNDTGTANYEGLYKNWGRLDNQEQRRKEILSNQKTNRNTLTDKFRGILNRVEAADETNIFHEKKAFYRPQIYVAGFNKCPYNNALMMSEWMVEKPEDFHENWFVIPCPKGVRTLVVANNGTTQCYTKFGHLRLECKTALPGGSPASMSRRNCCILDCFYVENIKTMYVLDLLAWNCQPMTDGETDFRHYWLLTNVGVISQLGTLNKKNQLIFEILPKTPCDPQSFNDFMMTIPHFPNYHPKLDGLLFYHKRGHYVSGQTPLVTWLFPFMVPEILGTEITVNAGYLIEMPESYVNQADFIRKFQVKAIRSGKGKKKQGEIMDTTPPAPVSNNERSKTMETHTGPQHSKTDDKKDPKNIEQMERSRKQRHQSRMRLQKPIRGRDSVCIRYVRVGEETRPRPGAIAPPRFDTVNTPK